ncbi:clasp N terminal-domain-containing protein [Ochromonadaceae sp. CCMP2298]|nr:clasp N terminal-domain-containing protein [Ochromonadaceae sp. CCMP2298]
MGFARLPNSLRPTELFDERDLTRILAVISAGLAQQGDWEKRTKALLGLQRLAAGNLSQFKSAPALLKGMHDLVAVQISDLRSVVSKEASRAVAALAVGLRGVCSPLVEFWWPCLLKVAVLKTQVVASAADKCLRCLVSCCPDSRLLSLILDGCAGKSAPLRRLSLQYMCLACACWRPDILERSAALSAQPMPPVSSSIS